MRKYKIVIIENDEDEQTFMREAFDEEGSFEILAQLDSGGSLLEWLEQHPSELPELILSDLNMPGRNGYDIISDIRKHKIYSGIPIVITSTSSAKVVMDKCYASGASLYLVKPDTFVEYHEFAQNLRKEIDERQLLR